MKDTDPCQARNRQARRLSVRFEPAHAVSCPWRPCTLSVRACSPESAMGTTPRPHTPSSDPPEQENENFCKRQNRRNAMAHKTQCAKKLTGRTEGFFFLSSSCCLFSTVPSFLSTFVSCCSLFVWVYCILAHLWCSSAHHQRVRRRRLALFRAPRHFHFTPGEIWKKKIVALRCLILSARKLWRKKNLSVFWEIIGSFSKRTRVEIRQRFDSYFRVPFCAVIPSCQIGRMVDGFSYGVMLLPNVQWCSSLFCLELSEQQRWIHMMHIWKQGCLSASKSTPEQTSLSSGLKLHVWASRFYFQHLPQGVALVTLGGAIFSPKFATKSTDHNGGCHIG